MRIQSIFENGQEIPVKYTADGQDVNPQLIVSDIPDNAKTLILVVEDPDAKRVVGHTFIHWVVFNIPANSSKITIKENSLPGQPGESSYKKIEYGGPNPPKGTGVHHYHFKVYAVDMILPLPEMSPLDKILKEADKNIIVAAELIGTYSRD